MLHGFNVGMKEVEPVIKSVLHTLTNFEVGKLPELPTLVSMLSETKALSYQQLGEELTILFCIVMEFQNLVSIMETFKYPHHWDHIL